MSFLTVCTDVCHIWHADKFTETPAYTLEYFSNSYCLELNILVTKGVPVEDDSYSDMFGRIVGDWMTPMLSGSAYQPDSIRDTQDEGQELYLHFFHEQLRREGIDELASEEERRVRSGTT